MRMNTKRLSMTALALCFAMPVVALADPGPVTDFFTNPLNSGLYVSQTDCTWEDTTGYGNYQTCCANCEDYSAELWERPIEDNKWEEISGGDDDGKRRLVDGAGGKYYGYADLASGKAGTDGTWVYIQWTSNEAFTHTETNSSDNDDDFLKGKYSFYFGANGKDPTAFYVDNAQSTIGISSNWVDGLGGLKVFQQQSGDDPPGSDPGGSTIEDDIAYTFDDDEDEADTGHGTTIITGGSDIQGRILDLDGGSDYRTVEIAVKISAITGYDEDDFAVSYSAFDDLDYFYLGIAESNPSSQDLLFANDHFTETIGSGVEYDTLALAGPAGPDPVPDPVPEPAGLGLIGLALLAVRRRRG